MKLDPETIDASIQEWEALLAGACHQTLNAADHGKLREVVKTMGQMARMLADKDATLRQLRQMLLKPATTERRGRCWSERESSRMPANRPSRRRKRRSARGMAGIRRGRTKERAR
jgi:hypothetical protein